MHSTSQEYLIKLSIGDSDFPSLLKLLFLFELKLNQLILLYFYFYVCTLGDWVKAVSVMLRKSLLSHSVILFLKIPGYAPNNS